MELSNIDKAEDLLRRRGRILFIQKVLRTDGTYLPSDVIINWQELLSQVEANELSDKLKQQALDWLGDTLAEINEELSKL